MRVYGPSQSLRAACAGHFTEHGGSHIVKTGIHGVSCLSFAYSASEALTQITIYSKTGGADGPQT